MRIMILFSLMHAVHTVPSLHVSPNERKFMEDRAEFLDNQGFIGKILLYPLHFLYLTLYTHLNDRHTNADQEYRNTMTMHVYTCMYMNLTMWMNCTVSPTNSIVE